MELSTIARRLPREAIGPALSARIRGRSDVEHLRRLTGIASGCTDDDLAAALAWCDTELRHVTHEDWGPPPWRAPHPRLTESDEILRLRVALCGLQAETASHATTSEFPVPIPAGLTLYPFQRAGVEYAQGKAFVLFADEMGLGKTVQAIGLLNCLPELPRVLIVCTATLKGNWQAELLRWSTRPLDISIIEPKTKALPESQIVIVNYDLLHRRELPGEFGVVVCDEAHYIRGETSKRTAAACGYLERASLRIILTGTPVVSSPADLLPVLRACGSPIAEDFEDRYVLDQSYERPNGYGGTFTVKKKRGSNQEELQHRLRALHMVRRLKRDVLPQLPEKTRQIIEIPGIHAHYDPVTEERIKLRIGQKLEDVDALRHAVFSRDEEIELDGHISKLRHEQAVAKAPYVCDHVRDLLEEDDARKIVVFGYHKAVIEIIEKELVKYKSVTITGDTPPSVRSALVAAFQDGETRLFIGNIYAAGEGITLHAAALAVFAEQDWVWPKIVQAEDRLHRIGQRSPVTIQHMVLAGSIDQMILLAMVAREAESRKTVG